MLGIVGVVSFGPQVLIERLNGLVDSNALVSARLSATQTSLKQLATVAQTFLSALTSAASGDANTSTVVNSAKAAVAGMTSVLNTSMNGSDALSSRLADELVAGLAGQEPGSTVEVRDLAGNPASRTGTIEVLPPKRRARPSK